MAKNKDKQHFWIPNEEVKPIKKNPTAREKPRNIPYGEHGKKLTDGLTLIKELFDRSATVDSLADEDIRIFKIEVPKGDKVQNRKNVFLSTGMTINAVKDERSAIVSTTKQQFQILRDKIALYTKEGTGRTSFDKFENFSPYAGSEKDSSNLRKKVYIDTPPEKIDIQILLMPHLSDALYDKALPLLKNKIFEKGGQLVGDSYKLSDDTPILRTIVPSTMLSDLENDSVIYRIEETRFYATDSSSKNPFRHPFEVDNGGNISSLPIVCVLDSGISLPKAYSDFICGAWLPSDSSGGDRNHGTKVASRVIFGNLGRHDSKGKIVPRARVIDCNILDGNVPEDKLIRRIQEAVEAHKSVAQIYNLSANANTPIEGDEMSIIGYELDALQIRHGIQFVVSAGNHSLWQTETDLMNVLDDDDSRISAPADSMLSITVGSIVGKTHQGSISKMKDIAPYSRRGPGFSGHSKPDMVDYSGTMIVTARGNIVPEDPFSAVMTSNGDLEAHAGTSFSAPSIAGDLAQISSVIPDSNVLLAKALLYHHALPLWDDSQMSDEELSFAHSLYGRGLSHTEGSMFSSSSQVTFVRMGTLNKITKERVTFYMPSILAAQSGRNVARVSVTCLSAPPVDRTKGSEYLGAYVRASLKKSSVDGNFFSVAPANKEGRRKWDTCHQLSRVFSSFNAGDWQVWLELFSRWEIDETYNIQYALIITIEDLSDTLDIYNEIELQNRFMPLNLIRLSVDVRQN